MTNSFWQQAHRERALAYDVIVVGGGLVGCSTAYWLLRRRPSLDVAILEARTLGAGASGRNAGFVLQGTAADFVSDVRRYGARTARRLWHFTRENRDLMASELQGSAVGWHSEGSLTAAADAREAERLRASVSHLRTAGAPVVYLSSEKANERIGAQAFEGGLYVTTGAVVDPLRLVQHIAGASGADIRLHQPVECIRWNEEKLLLQTPDLNYRAEQVVLAMGASLPSLVPSLSNLVRPVRVQMLATAPAPEVRIPIPVYSHAGGFYIRQVSRGDVLVGGGRHQHREEEETNVDATTSSVQSTIERYLHTHFPWATSLPVRQRWSGIMGFSPDGRPVVGEVPDRPGSFFATGFTGHGLGYGFRMGRLLARRMCGANPEGYDLFSVSRFEEREPKTSGGSSSATHKERSSPE